MSFVKRDGKKLWIGLTSTHFTFSCLLSLILLLQFRKFTKALVHTSKTQLLKWRRNTWLKKLYDAEDTMRYLKLSNDKKDAMVAAAMLSRGVCRYRECDKGEEASQSGGCIL